MTAFQPYFQAHRDFPMEDDVIRSVAEAILSFLQASPDCADTVEGIHRWWIRWPDVEEPVAVTLAALELLEKSEKLESFRAGSRHLWRLKRPAPDAPPACDQNLNGLT